MKLYAFDVDETLEFSAGPIAWSDVIAVRDAGHTIGICGNWGHITYALGRDDLLREISFFGPMEMSKEAFLKQIARWTHFEEYIMVGNDHRIPGSGSSRDAEAAELAGWRFIRENTFAAGAR